MKVVPLEGTTLTVAELVELAKGEAVILTRDGRPLVGVRDVSGSDWESAALAENPQFSALIEKSRRSYQDHGGIGLEQLRRGLGSEGLEEAAPLGDELAMAIDGRAEKIADRTEIIGRVLQGLRGGNMAAARDILRTEYPFVPVVKGHRRYSEVQLLQVFTRDGFIDRYSGQRLLFPGVLRLLSHLLPEEFPFHPNWKMVETHPAYWDLSPTIDHVKPVARGGADSEGNWVTTSMMQNAAKANWTLEEIGWTVHPPGTLTVWDGLMGVFVEFVDSHPSLLDDGYLKRWYSMAVRAVADA